MHLLRLLIIAGTGFGFAAGLGLGNSVHPRTIQGFLDFAGAWDPTLGIFTLGAAGAYAVFYRITLRLKAPLLGDTFSLPTAKKIDRRLIGGASLFGIGWGLLGFCPAPTIISVVTGTPTALAFLAMMTLGVYVGEVWLRRADTPKAPVAESLRTAV